MKNKILFIVPDGVGIRNYLYSSVFDVLYQKAEVVIYTPLPEKAILEAVNHKAVEVQKFIFDRESIITKVFREAATFARLLHNARLVKNDTILTNWNYKPKGIKLKIVNRLTMLFGRWATKKYARILSFERIANSGWSNKVIEKHVKHLQVTNPSKIFITHQRVASIMPICIAAKKLNIEVISVIYSWDNLPKARLAVTADKYLVWSDYMKAEMTKYYPEIDSNAIIVTGTPQFEFYQNSENIIEKNIFYKKYNLDINKKIICYSGDDTLTCPDDPKYLSDLAEEILKNKLDKEYQILLRRCPVDISGRFDNIVKKYSTIIKEATPIWNFKENESWTSVYPLQEDIKLLVSTAYYSELVINLGSTMAFDFAMFKKPSVYVNYNQSKKVVSNWFVDKIYNFEHFKTMNDKNAVYWWSDKAEIVDILNNAQYNQAMNQWCNLVLQDYDKASNKIITELLS
jgi:hypothetical protein